MSNRWVFSPSSESYLQRCIAAAPPPDANNKWFQQFGRKTSIDPDISMKETCDIIDINSPAVKEDATIDYEDIFDIIESECTLPVEYIMEECTKTPALITKMAEKLSTNRVEQLFEYIFSKGDIEATYFTFIKIFIPARIKLQFSRLCIDLLLKLNEICPQIFKELLEILINDTTTPNHVLNNYITAINEESITNFMKILSAITITKEGFAHNLTMIYTAYKESFKDDQIQNYIQNMIIQHSKSCTTDRNFGRLFLTFLQNEKNMERKVADEVIECLETNRSPFKRPCYMLLKDM